MKKLFISQPMTGLSHEQILLERNRAYEKAKEVLKDDVVVVLDSYFYDYNPTNNRIPLQYLAKSLTVLADADIVYFAEGWDQARGCALEHAIAEQYGINNIFTKETIALPEKEEE